MLFGKKNRRISNLLIVEDEPLLAFDTEHFLTESGYHIVATIDSVAAALHHLSEPVSIDLILADIDLIDGSGIDVARAALEKDIPVLFVTGDFPEEAMPLAAGCLKKPYPQRSLIAAIEAIGAVLEGAKPRRLPAGFDLFREAA